MHAFILPSSTFTTFFPLFDLYSLVNKPSLLLLQDGSLLAATINGFPLSTAKITEKRKIIEEIALADVKKVRRYFSHCITIIIQNYYSYFGITACGTSVVLPHP